MSPEASGRQGFVHLHVHTQFSLLDGAVPVEALPKAVKALGQAACAITDHNNLYGAVGFFKGCKEVGIQPLIGAGLWLAEEGMDQSEPRRHRGGHHLLALVEDQRGYENLCALITRAIFDGMHYKPRIDLALLSQHRDGLIFLTSGMRGLIRAELAFGDPAVAEARLTRLVETVGANRVYVELQDTALEGEALANTGCKRLAASLGLPTVVTNNVHYLQPQDAPNLEVLQAIGMGMSLNDPSRPRLATDQLYLKSEVEMRALFPEDQDAIDRTLEVAGRCHFKFTFGVYHFPASVPPHPDKDADTDENWAFFYRAFPPPRDFGYPSPEEAIPPRPGGCGNLNGFFRWYCREGLKLRLRKVPSDQHPSYWARLELEADIVIGMGFPAYYLIVAEFINWAKDNEIPVGPGRGSAAGSLCAYASRITDIDPIRFDLLFERFLNPERVSMPDVDVDFCQDRREEVIAHTREKYGADRVAQIITFGKLQAKMAVRDVARVCDLNFNEADRISKLIPEEIGITLSKALGDSDELQALEASDPKVKRILELAGGDAHRGGIEGLTRQTGVHAAGVVVAGQPLITLCPLYRDGPEGGPVVQYDMKSAEAIGLIKFDFLGLKTLDQIRDAVAMIHRNTGERIDMTDIDETDPKTYALLQSGDAAGVFQVESSGMRELLTKLKPSNLEDLVALVALYRPGPLSAGMVDDFIDRKHGRKEVYYLLPQLEPILKNTYGVVVYQEQVMQIAQVLSSYSLGEADLLRRAMGKKKPEEMAKQKSRFLQGAEANRIDLAKAEAIFDLLAMFAAYGFNKSHSAAYGYVSYQTAWLKANHRAEYMAALMSVDASNTDKVLSYITDCRKAGIQILPPDINASQRGFDVPADHRTVIRFGLEAVKGVGESAVNSILSARHKVGGRFQNLMHFLESVDLSKVNKRVVDHLIACGAFDGMDLPRAAMAEGLELALNIAAKNQAARLSGQRSLFGGGGVSLIPMKWPDIVEWPIATRLAREKEALGFFISGHPVQAYAEEVRRHATCTLDALAAQGNGREVMVAGLPATVRQVKTRRGDKMGIVQLQDEHAAVECVFFPDAWASSIKAIQSDKPLLVHAVVEVDEAGEASLRGESVELLTDLRERRTRVIHVLLEYEDLTPDRLDKLQEALSFFRGGCATRLHIRHPQLGRVVLRLKHQCAPDDELADTLARIFRRQGLVRFG